MAPGGRPDRSAKGLQISLDDDSKSSIEWQASLIESQLVIAVLQALRELADKYVDENEVKVECLTRFKKHLIIPLLC